jgi:hypothetical protein
MCNNVLRDVFQVEEKMWKRVDHIYTSISYKEKSLLVSDLHNMQHKQRMFFNEIKAQKSAMSNPETLNLC